MPICEVCGKEFDLAFARRSIGQRYGGGTYSDQFPDNDVCADCADEALASWMSAGAEVIELMDSGWDPDW